MARTALGMGVGALLAACLTTTALGQAKDVQHPFLLWTKADAAATQQRLATDPAAKKQLERMLAGESGKRANPGFLNLFKYAVLGDAKAGETEKKALLGFIGQRPPTNNPGDPNSGNAAWRDDRTLDALRYDVLYDTLSDQQRADIDKTIRGYVQWLTEHPNGPWGHAGAPRTGWLPNMQWPTVIGIHDLAVASKDERLITTCFEAKGGWKWYLDEYIAGDRWYMEEFGKYYSNIGAMMVWCEGLERLGLSQYGYGYTGKGGATMRKFLHMPIDAGYPRTGVGPGGTWNYGTVNMGDAAPLPIVSGYSADGTGGMILWGGGRMNGPIPKMMQPLWWELGARRFPEDGYAYFLAQLHKPGEDVYYPTLYFGLSPVEVSKVKAPPAPSVVTADRGFALLRADESPTYWESPKPAVSLQFGMYYVHYVHDCFSLLQYVAHNRYIYNKMGATQGNYAGGDPWRDHVRGQGSGVVVDGQRVQPVDRGDNGCEHQRIRQQLSPLAKFVAVRATMRHGEAPKNGPDTTFPINQERALVLTDDYLFDLFTLADPADKPHVYDWHVLAPATLEADAKWLPVEKLEKVRDQDLKKPYLSDLLVQDVGDKPWQVTLDQTAGGVAGGAAIPAGVNVWMLPAPGTALVAGRPPGLGDPNAGFKGAGASNRGVQLIATRTAPRTTFVALHDPYLGEGRVTGFAAVAQTDHGVAAAVTGKDGLNDRIIVCTGEKVDQPETFAGNGESFTATGYAFVRIRPEKVEVFGGLTAMKLKVTGHPTLEVNGKKADARVNGGVLEFSGR